MRHTVASSIGALLLAGAVGFPVAAEETTSARGRTRVPFPIPVATGSITLDGAVTEALWENALTLELRYEVRSGENIAPPVRTEMPTRSTRRPPCISGT